MYVHRVLKWGHAHRDLWYTEKREALINAQQGEFGASLKGF